jgi:hypothetical protein
MEELEEEGEVRNDKHSDDEGRAMKNLVLSPAGGNH